MPHLKTKPITKNIIEKSAIELFQSQGWEYAMAKNFHPKGCFVNGKIISNSFAPIVCEMIRVLPTTPGIINSGL